MSQSVVTIRLNGTPYQIGCGAGEEAHIETLAAEIEEVLQSLVGSVGQIGEARLLAMAALILADRAHDGGADMKVAANGEDAAVAALEQAAERILTLASKLSSN
ncbi:MAG: cell division protein ZapA [Pseudomonadota bacterium]|nr:cell division protein ZapA [Pseudomonadota bacterium]